MTFKLLWLPGSRSYTLEVFGGQNTRRRGYAGTLVFTPAEAVAFRELLLAGAVALGNVSLSDAGWSAPRG